MPDSKETRNSLEAKVSTQTIPLAQALYEIVAYRILVQEHLGIQLTEPQLFLSFEIMRDVLTKGNHEISMLWCRRFGKRAYLLSDRLRQTWYDLQRKDKYFGMAGVKHRRTIKFPSLTKEFGAAPPLELTEETIGSDLTEMQKQAETDFAELRSRYTKMTGFSLLSREG